MTVGKLHLKGFAASEELSLKVIISGTFCSRQITTPAPHHLILYTMLFLTPNQQCQSTEGNKAGI